MSLDTILVYAERIGNIGNALVPLALWVIVGYGVFRVVRAYAARYA